MIKKIVLFIGIFCLHLDVFANEIYPEEIPRFVLFLGRFHPLIVHLPIGAIIITFYLDIVGRIRKDYPQKTIQLALGFSSFFAIVACILGYCLSLEGDYNTDSLDIHFWTGILTAFLITVLFIISKSTRKSVKRIFFPFFVLTLISLTVAGHYGSVLTHGENFITEYASTSPKQKTITQIDSLQFYNDVVHKILDDKCMQCHNSTKIKGGLSLNSKELLLKGGNNGKIVHINNALNSTLYTNALLPLKDDLHMPPEGKPQLTKNELWLIHYWIDNGLDFTSKMAKIKSNDTLNT
ncbi:MAG: c-type cytochrome domain-containing protein, partial [Polaribacter sp.]